MSDQQQKIHFLLLLLCFNMIITTTVAAGSGGAATSNHTVEEAYQVLGISPNPNGSFTREIRIPMVNATPSVESTQPTPVALSKDIILPSTSKLSMLRLYRPLNPPSQAKLPIVIYFHGGDFVLFSATTVVFHNFCNQIASQIPALVVSVEHRLAPEYRLPAAYEDAMGAVLWARQQVMSFKYFTIVCPPSYEKYYGTDGVLITDQQRCRHDEATTLRIDFKRVFLLGSASGGNIAYNTAIRSLLLNLNPIKIKGLVINQPYFGGLKRTKSEIKMMEDPYVPLYVNDVLWNLALPLNATRDHPFSNPIKMHANTGDPLVDRAKLLAKLLKSRKVEVVSVIEEGGFHGMELSNATAAQQLYDYINHFVHSTI
ncbi:hypothetical protein ACS0TY_016893 [Phlomoides rotata]